MNKKLELKSVLGERLREFRKKMGFTQRDLASHFDVGMANYSRIERGEVFPNASILIVLRKEFHLSLDWLLLGNGTMLDSTSLKEDNVIRMESYGEDIKQLLGDMNDIPMLKHAVLTFYMEYKLNNEDNIHKYLTHRQQEQSKK